ncbi:HAMP domain-containing protein [Paraburkholderia sp. Tr-20389]|uniref:methyl-accepting chemotaxis protein n=1 Tax=Paraburkholderia sp. Tr-20389 TaxID=2703903 RepID=UPI00197FC44D|nr:methyl-accepting chemotaxis protein [Paraburkholderia sp. Tr-20389]MBN3754350.1 HAMP domain-containing protein [Paraburkholderia sp. Tr-20389]
MKFPSSIAFKICAVSCVALATTVILLTTVGAMNVRRQAVEAFESASHRSISQADEALDGTFQDIEQNLTYLAGTAEVKGVDQSLTDYMTHGEMTADGHGRVETSIFGLLKPFGESHPNMRYLYVGTKWGGFVQWPIESFANPYDPRARPWYELAMNSPDKVVRPAPYLSAASEGGISISFARVVKNAHGEVVGVIAGDVTLDAFAKVTGAMHFGETGYLMVADDRGKVLVDPRDKTHSFKEMRSLGGGYEQLAAVPEGLTSIDLNGTSYRCYVYTSPRNGWKYYALIPTSEMMAAANHLTITLIEIGCLVLGLALVVTITMARRMTLPLRRATASMYEIASGDGDMTRRLPHVSDDEVGQLAIQFNAFVEKVSGVLKKVVASSRQFELAAREVSAGNSDLSSRTEQQAASIEQTAAAMEQLTSNIRETADQVKNANEVVSNAVEVARRGNEAVLAAARTMAVAVEQSGRIVNIVAIIEGIAFQTNILALNAAVESARAGESGRGFAVVASEVRNLAQRSTNAAREIKALLESSVDNVKAGSEEVNVAGRTIATLTDAITNVADITSGISVSAREQSRAIDEVNQAVALFDQSTQQNATLVEEIAAASESLNSQGQELHSTVSFFKLH